MQIIEILGGTRIAINEEEKAFLAKVKSHDGLNLSQLNDRELEITDNLLRKNIININDYRVQFNGLQDPEYVQW